jgi:hypothetical protein
LLGFAVVSANWIGLAPEQNSDIPVIREHHLIRKLSNSATLRDTVDWLLRRQFLPVEGEHYELITTSSTLGGWNTQWYGIKPLIEDPEFLPL